MKKWIIIPLVLWCTFVIAQENTFQQAMIQAVDQLENAESKEDLSTAASAFERLGAAAPQEWLPPYYQAYCHILLASAAMEAEDSRQIATHLDQAQIALDRAKVVAHDESEVAALQGYIYTGRIWEAPMRNGARYSDSSTEQYQKAIDLNPENPRAYHLMGMHIFFTPKFFGGGPEKALPFLEKAAAQYALCPQEKTLTPNWGVKFNQNLLAAAQEELK
jgi:tetratricopeptide (TPR) repeat protein